MPCSPANRKPGDQLLIRGKPHELDQRPMPLVVGGGVHVYFPGVGVFTQGIDEVFQARLQVRALRSEGLSRHEEHPHALFCRHPDVRQDCQRQMAAHPLGIDHGCRCPAGTDDHGQACPPGGIQHGFQRFLGLGKSMGACTDALLCGCVHGAHDPGDTAHFKYLPGPRIGNNLLGSATSVCLAVGPAASPRVRAVA